MSSMLENDAGDTTGVDLVPPPLARPLPSSRHQVQFYEDREFLAGVVAEFLAAGLAAGESLFVIARPEHRELFARRLRELGLDPDAARTSGQLICLDAGDTLARLLVEGMPSRERFRAVVGGLFDAAMARAPQARIRAYGEMVDILWTEGQAPAALALEDLWNELQSRHDFSLLCAYTMGGFFTRAAGLPEVCASHDRVLPLDAPAAAGESGNLTAQYSRALAAEIRQRKLVEDTLRATVRELRGKEEVRAEATLRAERLMRITAAIADAVGAEHVFRAVVDEVAAALDASSAGLWLVSEDGQSATLVRAFGYQARQLPELQAATLGIGGQLPIVDCLRLGEPIWITSQTELLMRYPRLQGLVTVGRSYRICCLPIIVRGKTIAGLAFTFDHPAPTDPALRDFLMLVSRYSGQALERLRLLEAERTSRTQAELLYGLARALIEARSLEEVFEPALDAIERALGTRRCSVLLYDDEQVMRFRAWRGLSEAYRAAVEGHSPWSPRDPAPQPIVVPDVDRDPALTSFGSLFRQEGIGALAFFPLVTAGRLLGKFMVYYDRPHPLDAAERELARAIANHVAAACARFASMAELERTVRFNEMFTAILGHDLRNPLGAIMAAAQLAQRRQNDEKLAKPLSRILSSGQRMARMIDQLLDFTRVRVGDGIPLERKSCDLLVVLRQMADELEHANPGWHLHLHLEGHGAGSWDLDRLSQVFSNLIGNAIQHGAVEQGVKIRADGSADQRFQLEVQNMGTIPPALIGKLFEPMAGGERRSERTQGLGLGLYISKQIVEAHGGTIEVLSDEAAGTRFVVNLPRQSVPS